MMQRVIVSCVLVFAVALASSLGDANKACAADELRASKVLFLGNSITLHPPAEGMDGTWGMAASAAENDYVHLLLARIAEATKGKPESMVKNIADFERQHPTYDIGAGLKPELDFGADLVIVAIGENVPALTTEDAKTKYREAFANLLAELKRHGQPTIIVRGCFWTDSTKNEIMQAASDAAGATWVDLVGLDKDEKNFARSEREFKHAGIAGHPGDRGMAAIADAIWPTILEHAKAKAE